ncbi:DUF202 domain-containing protein [Phenylobacterium sp.]|nr:DUF202 domain-containing protein [Phenylobacterium sp.]
MRDPMTAEREMARERELRDVERTMISIVQTSISMIGFGFTIHAFLANVAVSPSGALGVDLDQVARRIGLALLSLGLINLSWGMFNQFGQLGVIRQRYAGLALSRKAYSPTPTFVVAGLLFTIGICAFLGMVFQAIG